MKIVIQNGKSIFRTRAPNLLQVLKYAKKLINFGFCVFADAFDSEKRGEMYGLWREKNAI